MLIFRLELMSYYTVESIFVLYNLSNEHIIYAHLINTVKGLYIAKYILKYY